MNLVIVPKEVIDKAHGLVYEINGRHGLIFGCPKCGEIINGSHHYDIETKTLMPAINCEKCQYHGHLIKGQFSNI